MIAGAAMRFAANLAPESSAERQPAPAGFSDGELEHERRAAYTLLLDLVCEDSRIRRIFEAQCRRGLAETFATAGRIRAELAKRGHEADQDAVEVSIPELASVLLPHTPAAAWEGLLTRVRRGRISFDTPVGAVQRMCALDHRLLIDLTSLALDPGGPDEAQLLCVTRSVWGGLRRRGQRHFPRRFSPHVWAAIRLLFPYAPGVRWSGRWAKKVRDRTLRDFAEHAGDLPSEAVDTARLGAAFNAMADAEEAGDRRAYLSAARRAVTAGRKAAREACRTNEKEG